MCFPFGKKEDRMQAREAYKQTKKLRKAQRELNEKNLRRKIPPSVPPLPNAPEIPPLPNVPDIPPLPNAPSVPPLPNAPQAASVHPGKAPLPTYQGAQGTSHATTNVSNQPSTKPS